MVNVDGEVKAATARGHVDATYTEPLLAPPGSTQGSDVERAWTYMRSLRGIESSLGDPAGTNQRVFSTASGSVVLHLPPDFEADIFAEAYSTTVRSAFGGLQRSADGIPACWERERRRWIDHLEHVERVDRAGPLAIEGFIAAQHTIPMPRGALLALLLLLPRVSVAGQLVLDPRDVGAALDRAFVEQLTRERFPGGAVVVVQDGRIVFAKGYGLASLESRKPVDAGTTLFRVASVTTLFTATAVMQQVERDIIRLDQRVDELLPALQVDGPFVAATCGSSAG